MTAVQRPIEPQKLQKGALLYSSAQCPAKSVQLCVGLSLSAGLCTEWPKTETCFLFAVTLLFYSATLQEEGKTDLLTRSSSKCIHRINDAAPQPSVVNIPIYSPFSPLFKVSITFLISFQLPLFRLYYLETTDIFPTFFPSNMLLI